MYSLSDKHLKIPLNAVTIYVILNIRFRSWIGLYHRSRTRSSFFKGLSRATPSVRK